MVDESGFAFCEDIIYALGDKKKYHLNYHFGEMPTVADLVYVVQHEEKGRYEATSVNGTGRPLDLLIRCVQGHSGSIGRQLLESEAFTQVTDARILPRLIHTRRPNTSFRSWVAPNPLASIQAGHPRTRSVNIVGDTSTAPRPQTRRVV